MKTMMKKMIMALFAIAFAFNAQAAQIAWQVGDVTLNDEDYGFNGNNPNGTSYSLVNVLLVDSDNWLDISTALNNGTINASTPGILGAQFFIPGSAQVETYYTGNPNIVAGQDYDVYFVFVCVRISGDMYDWCAYIPFPDNGKANSANALPVIYNGDLGWDDGGVDGNFDLPFLFTPFTVGEAVPEPATGLLALVGGALFLLRRKRK